jgi:hypothetical protein
MKNFQIKSLAGLLLFIFTITLVIIAVIKNDDLYVAYAILLSCVQFYLYKRFNISRIFFEGNVHEPVQPIKCRHIDKKGIRYHEINLN